MRVIHRLLISPKFTLLGMSHPGHFRYCSHEMFVSARIRLICSSIEVVMRVLIINDDRDDIAIFCSAIVELHPDALCSSLDNPEELYYKVQEVLDGKKRQPYRLKVAAEEICHFGVFLYVQFVGAF